MTTLTVRRLFHGLIAANAVLLLFTWTVTKLVAQTEDVEMLAGEALFEAARAHHLVHDCLSQQDWCKETTAAIERTAKDICHH